MKDRFVNLINDMNYAENLRKIEVLFCEKR